MNAGTDHDRAKAHAQANANWSKQTWCVHQFEGTYWVNRLSAFGPAAQQNIRAGKTDTPFEIIEPEKAA